MQKKIPSTNHFTLFSLSAVFFFGPFLKQQLKDFSFSSEEEQRLQYYISIGRNALVLFLLGLLMLLIEYYFSLPFNISLWIFYLLLLLLFFGVVTVFFPIDPKIANYPSAQKFKIIQSFIPGYGTYLWYHSARYENPIRRYKESELFWFFITIASLISFKLAGGLFLFLILRVVLLFFGIDLIPNNIKFYLNRLFSINVEEIITYLFYPLGFLGTKKSPSPSISGLTTLKASYHTSLSFLNIRIISNYLLSLLIAMGSFFYLKNMLGVALFAGLVIMRIFIVRILTKGFIPLFPRFGKSTS